MKAICNSDDLGSSFQFVPEETEFAEYFNVFWLVIDREAFLPNIWNRVALRLSVIAGSFCLFAVLAVFSCRTRFILPKEGLVVETTFFISFHILAKIN